MPRQTVPVVIELPIDLAEFLVHRGDEIVRAIKDAVAQARRSAKVEEWRRGEAERKRKQQSRQAKFFRDGRAGHRALRRRLAELPPGIRGKALAKARGAAVDEIAGETGLPAQYLAFAVQAHRRSLLRRLRRRRKLWVLRYLLQGQTGKEIAARVRASISTVEADISGSRAEAKAAGCSLVELETTKTASRRAERTPAEPDNVIRWSDIEAARGRAHA